MDEQAYLFAMIAQPNDSLPRWVYADWLEERGDARSELLRTEWGNPRLSFVDAIARAGSLDYYLQTNPELRSHVQEHDANQSWRAKIDGLGTVADQAWLAIIDTLGRPFRPFYFWNNTGPRMFQERELPFRERIGTRGAVVTFESSFRGESARQPGLDQDLHFLYTLQLSDCEYGAAKCPLHPFVGELESEDRPLTGALVLQGLKASEFQSRHILTLDTTTIPYPGYHPGSQNDEVHSDDTNQSIFPRPQDLPEMSLDDGFELESERITSRHTTHESLRASVVGGQLWYVLLHSRIGLRRDYGSDRHSWVILFAVGKSLRGNRLIGVVTNQLCHNFCD